VIVGFFSRRRILHTVLYVYTFELTEIMRERPEYPMKAKYQKTQFTNQDTDRYIREKLNSIPTDQFNSEAIDSVKSAQLSLEQRNRCLEQARTLKTSETQGLCTALILKTTVNPANVDTSDGLDNGSTGVLRDIGFSTFNTPNILWIQLLDESIGDSGRSKCSHRQEPSWTPVVKIIKSFQINSSQATTIDRKQSQGGSSH